MEVEQQVLSFEPSSNKPGSWLKMKTIDDKGTPRDAYLKDQSLIPLVAKPGIYSFTKEKKGSYWEITGVKFIRPLGDASPASNGQSAGQSTQSSARSSTVADVNVVIQNRAITAQVCVKAAAELFGKALEVGAFKFTDAPKDVSQIDTDTLTSAAACMARKFMDECKEFVAQKPAEVAKPAQSTQTTKSPEGA